MIQARDCFDKDRSQQERGVLAHIKKKKKMKGGHCRIPAWPSLAARHRFIFVVP